MSAIESALLDPTLTPDRFWAQVSALALGWLDRHRLSSRDAIIVLPFAELLPLCRRALALAGGWMPRVETLRSLTASLGPLADDAPDAPSGDAAVDSLIADRWLAQLPGTREWRRRDRAAYDHAVADVVQAAHALIRAAAAQPAPTRSDWWARAGDALPRIDGPGAMDSALARLALQWAQLGGAPPTDRLSELRPCAWIVLQAGGDDAVAQALLTQAAARDEACLQIMADAVTPDPFDPTCATAPTLWTAASAEDEAWAAAIAVIDAVTRGQVPVALIAQDRLLVRRIRALLERAQLQVADESGWVLSTTRAAANLMAVLRAAHPAAGADAWLDGLKVVAVAGEAELLDRLERHWRRQGPGSGSTDQRGAQPNAALARALAWWQARRGAWQRFAAPGRHPLRAWLAGLSTLADAALRHDVWAEDVAAQGVRRALRLDVGSVRPEVDALTMTLDDFIAWVQGVLEQASFIAPVTADPAQVVITPLARAILRPFGAIVLPGADERRLGLPMPAPALLPEALLERLGMDHRERRQRRAALGFVQLLRHPRVLLLRRSAEGSEHLGASPWLDRLQSARHRAGLPPLDERPAPLLSRQVPAAPVARPRPTAVGALPDGVSASAVEALRACPYRFFARTVLGLGEAEELELDPGKRDYGSLLHDALHRFHEQRVEGQPGEVQAGRLVALAAQVAREAGLDGPAMLPFAAGLPAFALRYGQWQAQRELEGWHYEAGELAITVDLGAADAPAAAGLPRLRGRIDRIDRQQRNAALQLIDYKTGSAASLRAKLKQPLEDTQLAFYAAQLMLSQAAPETLLAGYAALDERARIVELDHRDVRASAQALVLGLGHDWRRLQAGAPFLALGEGAVCDSCEARGLCRRDHWPAAAPSSAP